MGGTPLVFPATNVVLGGYDGSLAGLTLKPDPVALALSLNFAYASHAQAIRSLALSSSTLASGGVDEVIRLYDLSRGVEVGTLLQHSGTINALRFAYDGRKLMLSASDDKSICVWQCRDWSLLKRLTAHSAAVLDVAVHRSARVAISVARDRTLFMWNLSKGKVAFSAKTKAAPATSVRWAPGIDQYSLVAGSAVTLSDTDGRDVRTFSHDKEVLCSEFLEGETIATGGEEKIVRLWDVRARKSVAEYEHDRCVRDLAFVSGLLISADSAGGLKMWDQRMGRLRLETGVQSAGLRLTCMAASKVDGHLQDEFHPAVDTAVEKKKPEESWKQRAKRKKKERNATPNSAEKSIQKPLEGTASQRKRKKKKARDAS